MHVSEFEYKAHLFYNSIKLFAEDTLKKNTALNKFLKKTPKNLIYTNSRKKVKVERTIVY